MTSFQQREQGFEAKFARDEEFRFRVAARRDRLFAQWAAERLRLPSQAAAELVAAALGAPGGPGHDSALLQRIAEAFAARGAAVPASGLAAALGQCAAQAERQLLDGPPAD